MLNTKVCSKIVFLTKYLDILIAQLLQRYTDEEYYRYSTFKYKNLWKKLFWVNSCASLNVESRDSLSHLYFIIAMVNKNFQFFL